ncbi:protein of unknown function [Nocardioides exalbidus]|uniref:Protein-glutamine gamma-glutamyltransferase-like C-terminal domain-containing protein n=1 Tax=Nocardioides exalbidus TaxID=402596 RepID=A0A1H4UIR7_9ACTN|nr:DUF4129 domain-containing protein [Nocardioides exalbidus]SEC68772.1 protein of unknown function [Nocardioides exalbidus]
MRVFPAVPPGARAVLVVAVTTLFMVLAAWATLIGPSEVFTGPGRLDFTVTKPAETCVPSEVVTGPDGTETTTLPDNPRRLPVCEDNGSDPGEPRPTSTADAPTWVKVLLWVFVAGLLLVLLAFLVFLASVLLDRRGHRREAARTAVDFDTLGEPGRLAAAITRDAAQQDAALREGDPRNAIVAAWQRFEVQGEQAGVPRRSWETSSEYAIRILDLVAADAGAVNRLAVLYREARFSEHPITEVHRTEALEALGEIRARLGVRG